MAMRASKVWIWIGAALLLAALLLSVAPALARAGHGGHSAAAAAASFVPATRHTVAHHRNTLPCCAGPSCADLAPLPGDDCPAAPHASMDDAYRPAGDPAVNGFDPSPAAPPPRHAP